MRKNMGTADRTIRIVIALALGAVCLTGVIKGALAIILGVVAAVFFVTALAARCPAYVPMHLSTRRKSGGAAGT